MTTSDDSAGQRRNRGHYADFVTRPSQSGPRWVGGGGARISAQQTEANLSHLLMALEVDLHSMSECVVSTESIVVTGKVGWTGLCYVLTGTGRVILTSGEAVPVLPHTLIISPPDQRLRLDATEAEVARSPSPERAKSVLLATDPAPAPSPPEGGAASFRIFNGCFHARHGRAIDLFADMTTPIVEYFEASGGLQEAFEAIIKEIEAQDLGVDIMAATLLKQILVALFRRAAVHSNTWIHRVSALGDPQVSRAYAVMVARPGARHSIQSLSEVAGLGRSMFMERFTLLFGRSPMALLRDLRMQQAAILLAQEGQFVDRVAQLVGYTNRSSFYRAFRKAHGVHPSDFRTTERRYRPGDRR